MIHTAKTTYSNALSKKYEQLLLENDPDSYREFVAKNGVRADAIYKDAEASSRAEKLRADTNFGAKAERISEAGLSESGYEDYVKSLSESAYRASLGYAEHIRALGEYKNTKGYEAYVSDYEKMQDRIAESFIESFAKSGSFDGDAAYRDAIKAGLGSSRAFFAAEKAVDASKENVYERALVFAKANGLTAKKAEEYAKALGLDKSYRKRIYDAISVFTEQEKAFYSSMTPEQYYDYIISLARK